MRPNRRFTFNRYFVNPTAAIATNSWSNLVWTPGNRGNLILGIRCVALWVPAAGGVNVCVPNRFSLSGAQNLKLDNSVDSLPGAIPFDNNTLWGITTPDGSDTPARHLVPQGATVTLQGRAYCPAAAFGAADTIEYYLQITYEEVYNVAGI